MAMIGCPSCGKTMSSDAGVCPHCGASTSAPRAAGPTIACDKCKQGTMQQAKVPRMSPGLRMIGFTLWVPALALLILSAGCGLLVGGTSSSTAANMQSTARGQAADRLLDIAAIQRSEIDDFNKTGTLSPAVLHRLSADDRAKADSIISGYHASVAGGAIGTSAAAGMAGLGVIAVYVVCIPLFIVGLILTLKRKVWKCPTCGYVFDRA